MRFALGSPSRYLVAAIGRDVVRPVRGAAKRAASELAGPGR